MKEHTYEKVYSLLRVTTAKEIIANMSCEELQRILIEAKNPYGLEEVRLYKDFNLQVSET